MIRVNFDGTWDVVVEAASRANLVLASKAFYEAIRAHTRFDLTDASPNEIGEALEQCTLRLTVSLYKSRNPWSRALGYEDERQPNIVFLNTRKLNRSVASIVGTIVHEAVHAADAHSSLEFHHGDDSSIGKENTAPYWIGNLGISIASGSAFAAVDHAPHDVAESLA